MEENKNDRARNHSHRFWTWCPKRCRSEKVGRGCHPRLRRHRLSAGAEGCRRKDYSTYYTTRKDNAWAKANPDEVQQCYIMTGFYTAPGDTVTIPLMKGISPELMQVNTNDDITRWWEVMDRNHRSARAPGAVELR